MKYCLVNNDEQRVPRPGGAQSQARRDHVRKVGIPTLALVCVLFSSTAHALPSVGASANTIPSGTFMMDVWGIWQDYSLEYDAGDDEWRSPGPGVTVTSGSLVPRVYYGLTDKLTVRASLPFEDRYGEDASADGGGKSNSGLGDIVIDPKMQVFRGEGGYPRLAVLAGVRLPTGATSGVESGLVAPVSDGSTDYMLGAVITQEMGPATAHACVTYWMNGKTESGADSPDVWVGLATVEMKLDTDWTLLWEYKGVFGSESRDFYRTYACPGIAWDGERVTMCFSALVSAAASGGRYDFDWAPYMRFYCRFF